MRDVREIRRLAGQVFAFGFDGTDDLGEEIQAHLHERHLGNVILFARNIETPEQTRRLTDRLQASARSAGQTLPLTISADQENGIVRRLKNGFTLFPGNMALGAANDLWLTEQVALATARELRAIGINMDLAPVLDVNNNPANPVIGVRSFGEDPERVAEHGKAFVRGLRSGGVLSCAKHFPGHGDTAVDSHLALPTVPHPRSRLDNVELLPFRAAVSAEIDAVMTAHIVFSAIDPQRPATISPEIVTGLLRQEFGYEGLIVTDSLGMKAISSTIGVARGAIESFLAGCDMLMVANGYENQVEAYDAFVEAVMTGEIPFERLQLAVQRIERVKRTKLSARDDGTLGDMSSIRSDGHLTLARTLAERSVTVVRGVEMLPLDVSSEQSMVCVTADKRTTHEAEEEAQPGTVTGELLRVHPKVAVLPRSRLLADSESVVSDRVEVARYVIVETPGEWDEAFSHALDTLAAKGKTLVGICPYTPYDAARYPQLAVCLTTYDPTPVSVAVAVEALFGRASAQGSLPVRLQK